MRGVASRDLSAGAQRALEGYYPWSPEVVDHRPIVVEEVCPAAELAEVSRVLLSEGIGSVGFFPVRGERRLLGMVMVGFDHPQHLDEEAVALVEVAVGHLASAIEREALATELRRARGETHAVLHSFGDGVTVQTLRSVVRYANDPAVALFGFDSLADVVGSTDHEVMSHLELFDEDGSPIGPSDLPGPTAMLRGGPVSRVVRARGRGGTSRWLSISATPLSLEDETLAVTVFRDVTEERQAELMWRESEGRTRAALRMAKLAEQRKDEFLAILGHELRNPLAPIVTALQLMSLKGDKVFERERTIIDRQVQYLMRLVDDLLDVSRITRGMLELKLHPIELSFAVDKALEVASALLEQREQSLAVDLEPALYVNADALRLAQVIANLLTNAAKNTDPGGAIEVVGRRNGDLIELAVRDDGRGIEPELAPNLFDMFVQGAQSLERERGGLGLGLAIVKRLTEMHGGTVRCHSDGAGRGSCFTISLPASTVSPAPPLALADDTGEHHPMSASERLLLVDDNVDAADMLGEVLMNAGFEVRTAHDGPAALAVAAAFKPSIAVLDIGLPVMDGYEVAEKLRAMAPAGIRLIAVTGYGQRQDRHRSAEAGFEAHLVKPISVRELLVVLSAE